MDTEAGTETGTRTGTGMDTDADTETKTLSICYQQKDLEYGHRRQVGTLMDKRLDHLIRTYSRRFRFLTVVHVLVVHRLDHQTLVLVASNLVAA
jgi:hypothetical protein